MSSHMNPHGGGVVTSGCANDVPELLQTTLTTSCGAYDAPLAYDDEESSSERRVWKGQVAAEARSVTGAPVSFAAMVRAVCESYGWLLRLNGAEGAADAMCEPIVLEHEFRGASDVFAGIDDRINLTVTE